MCQHLSCCSHCSSFGLGELFQNGSYALSTQAHSFRNLMLISGITGSPRLICYLPCLSPGVNYFSKVPGFHWRMLTLFLGGSTATGWHGTSLLIGHWIPDFNMCLVSFMLLRVRKSRVRKSRNNLADKYLISQIIPLSQACSLEFLWRKLL